MSRKAKAELLEELHNATVEQLVVIITRGVPLVSKEGEAQVDGDGNVIYVPASPAYYSAAIKLLKDNNITADLSINPNASKLISTLPTFDAIEGEDYEEVEE